MLLAGAFPQLMDRESSKSLLRELDANGHCAVLSRFSRVQLCVTPWTVAHQAPRSMGILQASILEWVYSHSLPSPGDLTNPGIEPMFLMSSALAGLFFTA